MRYSDNAMAAILMTSRVGLGADPEARPLTLGEWGRFLEGMEEAGREPGDLLSPGFPGDGLFPPDMWARICGLLARGGAAALELEDLEKRGIGLVTVFDPRYPALLRPRLGKKAPPVFFYAGSLDLAGKDAVAVAGSRNADLRGLEFTEKLARKAAGEGLAICSGGAKGVDAMAEEAAIRGGGAVISYIADPLRARIRRKDSLAPLMDGKLLLLSDMHPDAGFSAGRAMARNKYVYASSRGAFVVGSDWGKGGTWAGAAEALKHGWTVVCVWDRKEVEGNRELIKLGGRPYELSDARLTDILAAGETPGREETPEAGYEQLSLFDDGGGDP